MTESGSDMEKVRRHVLVTGAGRSGTTFLMALLTELGLDTGFSRTDAENVHPISHAGLERDLRDPSCPYIVKTILFPNMAAQVLADRTLKLDHVIIPMRTLTDAAASRSRVSAAARAEGLTGKAPGGLWTAPNYAEQINASARTFYNMMHVLAEHETPITLLAFPRLALDAAYLYEKLAFLFGGVRLGAFIEAHMATSKPERIHSFDSETGEAI